MEKFQVTLTKSSDYTAEKINQSLQRHFQLLGGLGRFVRRGDSVLMKPNMIAPKSRRHATQTDPAIILETARLLKDIGARPFLGDSPAWGNVFNCVGKLKLKEPLKRLGVPVRQLNKPKKCRIGPAGTTIAISSVALDADVIINMPKFKSHQQLVATFAVKNMFGCVSGKQKALWHFIKGGKAEQFCRLLIDVYDYLKPAVTIIDGVVAMDRRGPIRGRPRNLGWIIAGAEPIACEIICAKLSAIKPDDVPIIKTAKKINFGCSDEEKIEILGDNFAGDICNDFELCELIPIRFSLLHVCKSVCKQIFLLAKEGLKS